MATPETEATRWARNGDVDIAYRCIGDGPVDLLFVSGVISHIEVLVEEPGLRRWFERLGRIARVVLIDRRGSGMSATPPGEWDVEDEVADLEAVLDAIGSERAVIQSYAAGGPLALAFAALRAERTLALILYASVVRSTRDDEIAWAFDAAEREETVVRMVAQWGTGANIERMAPSAADDQRMRDWLGRLERQSMPPSGIGRVGRMLATFDVRPLLPRIAAPVLILHREDDRMIDVRHARYLAERLAGARLVVVPGVDSLPMVGDSEALIGEIEAFITGRRGDAPDRELLTVLFTDIVDATSTAATLGDARWRDLLAAHDRVVRRELATFGGVEVKTIGDAFLATFSGPPSQALRCAQAIGRETRRLGIDVRAGVHTGECERIGGDVGGMAVHIASRIVGLAGAGEIWVSGTVYGTVVGSGLAFTDRGAHDLRGVPGWWPIFTLDP